MYTIKKEIIFKLKRFKNKLFQRTVSKPILAMVKKPIWKDEWTT